MSAPDVPELDDIASRALASIILEHVALVMGTDGGQAAAALTGLETATGLSLDVCAGVLMACSFLAGTGQLDGPTITGGAMTLDPSEGDDQ